MARDPGEVAAERILLLTLLATFLFVGGSRIFLSSVYYQNLSDLGLNATALYALLLLAPVVFLIPGVRAQPRATLILAALGLGLGRALLAPTRGTAIHLALAGLAAASFLVLLGALLSMIRRRDAPLVAAGLVLGWALDIAIVTQGDSADPTSGLRGLLLVLPIGALVALTAIQLPARAPTVQKTRTAWAAGAGLGVWLFLENTILGNPYGLARWNETAPALASAASLAGLIAGALLALRSPLPRAWLLALHAGLALALLDHSFLHSPLLPLFLFVGQAAMTIDAAFLVRALVGPRAGIALVLTGLVSLVHHFVFAFTYQFAYVPLGSLWEGRAPMLIAFAALVLLGVVARQGWERPPQARRAFALAALPALVGVFALATPGLAVPDAASDTFSIMTFNVHQGFANDGAVDPSVFLTVLKANEPDIVVLQEADTPRFTSGNLDIVSYLAARGGYHEIYGQPTRAQAYGGSILTRSPIREWHTYELPSATDDRYYTEARLDIHGQDVWLYAVHFTLDRESRLAERDAILAQAATRDGPLILAGDFNSCPTSLCPGEDRGTLPDDIYSSLAARYHDPWVELGHDANASEAFTYEATRPDQRIDYIFHTDAIETIAYERLRTPSTILASDHLPVRAEMRLRAAG